MLDDGTAVPKHTVLPNLFYIEKVVKGLKYVIYLNQLLSFEDRVLHDACLPSSHKFCICHFPVDCNKFNVWGFSGLCWHIVYTKVRETWSVALEAEGVRVCTHRNNVLISFRNWK